jgi:DnaJ-domain-containing protein 1
MKLDRTVLDIILDRPGTSRQALCRMFDLSDYRLNRVFRHIERELTGRTIAHDKANGVWVVPIEENRCSGLDWVGADAGGYVQCSGSPEFPDGRCFNHSRYESPEMVAFGRRLAYLSGPTEPTPQALCELTLTVLEELLASLMQIEPMTQQDVTNKARWLTLLKAALATMRWKDLMRRRRMERRIPFEFEARHRMSSGNTYEYSLKKYFVLLEVPTEATKEQVLKAWKKLARQHHPDAEGGDEERMKAINAAKERIFRLRRWD